jgi:hypothetical protein
MESAGRHRTLIVANRTALAPVLMQEIERRAAERPTTFALLIPNVASRKQVDWTMAEALKSMRKAARGPFSSLTPHVDGLVGGEDAFESVRQALADGSFDDVIISTLPKRTSEWLRRDLPRRVEALGLPVTVITPPPEDPRSTFEKFASLPPAGPG